MDSSIQVAAGVNGSIMGQSSLTMPYGIDTTEPVSFADSQKTWVSEERENSNIRDK